MDVESTGRAGKVGDGNRVLMVIQMVAGGALLCASGAWKKG